MWVRVPVGERFGCVSGLGIGGVNGLRGVEEGAQAALDGVQCLGEEEAPSLKRYFV